MERSSARFGASPPALLGSESVCRRGRARRGGDWRRAGRHLAFAVIPLLSVPVLVVAFQRWHILALDFHNWYWPAGERVLHGQSPYLRPYPMALYYPPIGALLFAPFALLA